MVVKKGFSLATTLLLLLALSTSMIVAAQGIVTIVYPDGSTKTIPKTPYIETSILYTGKFAMKGTVIEVVDASVIHVEDIGYIKLADILVPSEKASQAKEYLSNLLLSKTVYLDIDDKNVIDQAGRISAIVYLPLNNTTVLNVNFDLVIKGYAYIFNEANEFNPSQWVLEEKLTSQTGSETTTTTTVSENTTATTTITVTSVIPIPTTTQTQTETPVENTNTTPPVNIGGGEVVVIEETGDNNPPPPPVVTTTPPSGVVYTLNPQTKTITKTIATTITVTYTTTTTIQRYLTFTLTAEGELPFHATPLGVSLIAALSALLGSLITIALLRKYITTT